MSSGAGGWLAADGQAREEGMADPQASHILSTAATLACGLPVSSISARRLASVTGAVTASAVETFARRLSRNVVWTLARYAGGGRESIAS